MIIRGGDIPLRPIVGGSEGLPNQTGELVEYPMQRAKVVRSDYPDFSGFLHYGYNYPHPEATLKWGTGNELGRNYASHIVYSLLSGLENSFFDDTTLNVWSATTAYVSGNTVRPSIPNGLGYEFRSTNGTSGSVEPSWSQSIGSQFKDDVGNTWKVTAKVNKIDFSNAESITIGYGLGPSASEYQTYVAIRGLEAHSQAIELTSGFKLGLTTNEIDMDGITWNNYLSRVTIGGTVDAKDNEASFEALMSNSSYSFGSFFGGRAEVSLDLIGSNYTGLVQEMSPTFYVQVPTGVPSDNWQNSSALLSSALSFYVQEKAL